MSSIIIETTLEDKLDYLIIFKHLLLDIYSRVWERKQSATTETFKLQGETERVHSSGETHHEIIEWWWSCKRMLVICQDPNGHSMGPLIPLSLSNPKKSFGSE